MINDVIDNQIGETVEKIRKGEIDINTREIFFSSLIKGLIYDLNGKIKVRNISVPHIILHTGDDRMWIEERGYDNSIEPAQISNESSIYNIIPRCNVNLANIDLDAAQLTNPYSIGNFQYEDENIFCSFSSEFRRMPIKISVELSYFTDSYTDMLELIQHVIANMSFVRTFDIVYMGQKIKCSYKIPDSFSDEHTMELDGTNMDNKSHKMSMSIEVESNMPIFNNRTVMQSSKIICDTESNIKV